jgi:hypothetical protein
MKKTIPSPLDFLKKEIESLKNELLQKDLLLNKVKHFKTTKTYKVLKFLKLCSL